MSLRGAKRRSNLNSSAGRLLRCARNDIAGLQPSSGWLYLLMIVAGSFLAGCAGYSNDSLFPDDLRSVYVEMFDNRTFRRGLEYTLSDALAKRILSDTPYWLISDRDRTDSVMSGQLVAISESILTLERETGRALEKEVVLTAVVNWKNLRTGRMMLNNETVTAAVSYSDLQNQDFTYASGVAANKLAQKIVEIMENNW